jgi:succinyl-diaminopimelate desuccinylase
MKELLTELISHQSLSNDILANEKLLVFCQKHLHQQGISSEINWHTKHPSLEWGANIRDAEILINTHVDVVPAPHQLFTAQEQKAKLIGRGAADTKAMVSVFLSLNKELVKTATKKGVRFVLVSDEEIGGDTTRELVSKMTNLKFALFGEPTQLKLNNEAKGIMQISLTAQGSNAHGSQPWAGENAIIKLTKNLQSFLTDHPIPTKYSWETTFNFAQIKGGTAINQVPADAELICDVRYKPTDNPQAILTNLEKYFGKDNVQVIRNESHIFTKPDNKFVKQFEKSLVELNLPVTFSSELGSSDARHCTNLNIPCLVFGPIGADLHQDTEWVNLESISTAKEVIEEFLHKL